jgi:hypothetical protein
VPKCDLIQSPRALALLDDRLDRTARRCQVGDRDQFGPFEDVGDGLRPRRADEHGVFAVAVAQVG